MLDDFDSPIRKRKIIAQNVRARRKSLDLLQRDLADALMVDTSRIVRIEKGQSPLHFEEIEPLCEFLGIEDQTVLYKPEYYLRS